MWDLPSSLRIFFLTSGLATLIITMKAVILYNMWASSLSSSCSSRFLSKSPKETYLQNHGRKQFKLFLFFLQFYYNNHFLNFLDRKSPVNHLCRPLVHSNNISFLCYCIQKHIFPELHLIPQTASIFSCKITTIHICIIHTISSL